MLALVAVNHDWVRAGVAQRGENIMHEGLGYIRKRFLVALGWKTKNADSVLLAELQVALGVLLRTEVEDAAKTQGAQEWVILLCRVPTPVHTGTHEGEVDGRYKLLLLHR